MNRLERIEVTRRELLEQPDALRRTLAATEESVEDLRVAFRAGRTDAVYIVGSGDSFIVGEAIAAAWETWLGVPVRAMQALEYARQSGARTTPETIVVAISASGGSWATEQALQRAIEEKAVTIGVSGRADAPLTRLPRFRLVVPATRVGWPTQSTTSQIGALLRVGLAWSEADRSQELAQLSALPDVVAEILSRADAPTKRLASELAAVGDYFFAGSGPCYASARMAAAKVKEMSQDHATAIYLEEFHHYYTVKSGECLFLLAPSAPTMDRAVQTAEEARKNGVEPVVLTDSKDAALTSTAQAVLDLPESAPFLQSITYALPLHLFSQHLAMQKRQPDWELQDHQGKPLSTRKR